MRIFNTYTQQNEEWNIHNVEEIDVAENEGMDARGEIDQHDESADQDTTTVYRSTSYGHSTWWKIR